MPTGAAQPLLDAIMQAAQMRNQDRQRQQEFSADQAKSLAEQHWREAEAKIAEAKQKRLDDPNSLENQLTAAEIADRKEQTRLRKVAEDREERLGKQWEDTNRNTERRITDTEARDAYGNWSTRGGHYGTAMAAISDPDVRKRFDDAALAELTDDWNQKYQKAVAKRLAQTPSPDGAIPAQGMAQGMATGNPLAGMLGAVGGAMSNVDAEAMRVAKAHMDAFNDPEVGPKPTIADLPGMIHPSVQRKMQLEEVAKEKSEAQIEVLHDTAKKLEMYLKYAPEVHDSMMGVNAEKIRRSKELGQIQAKMEKHKEWFDGENLNIKKVLADATVSRTNTYASEAQRKAVYDTARLAVGFARDEVKSKETQLRAQEKVLSSAKAKAASLKDLLNETQSQDSVVIEQTQNSPAIKRWQADNIIATLEKEADPNHKDSAAYNINQLTNEIKELQTAGKVSTPVAGPVGAGGKQLPFGTSIGGSPGKTGGVAPVKIKGNFDYAKLPSGTEFIGPDGKRRRKP